MNPFIPTTIASLTQQFATPLWIYDADTIKRQIDNLRLFDVVRFAQKANSNTHILRIMKRQGAVVDSVSLGEIERALAAGFMPGLHNRHADIVFTSDLLDRATLARVVELNIPVNCGSMDMLDQLGGSTRDIQCGCVSTLVLGMDIPIKQIPVASIVSMVSSMVTSFVPARKSSLTNWIYKACTCI